jgi:hypothetical protein
MRLIILSVMTFFVLPVFACVDISGKYLIGSRFYVQFEQNGCRTLTHSWCDSTGSNCGADSYTWTLDGELIQDGGNPSYWASISPKGDSLHRINLWDLGTIHSGLQCWWKEQWYAKTEAGDLRVTYKLFCIQDGQYQVQMKDEIWPLVK